MFKAQKKVKISWSPDFAYAIGLITSDGSLNKDGRHIWFCSKNLELTKNFRKALNLEIKIGKYARGGEKEKRYYWISFGDIYFYKFLNKIGLAYAKSKTIQSVQIPAKYFGDFLRGLFDGDGTFYSYWDKRWPNSFGFKLSYASASLDFIEWLKHELTKLYGVKGYIHKGDGVFNLEYVKGDTKKIFEKMNYRNGSLFLRRKYIKLKSAIDKDKEFGLSYLQKSRNAAVAQW